MNKIINILNEFAPISLSEMDEVKLLDRMDTKFTFHFSELPELLREASNNYRVLEVNNVRINKYETLYFDTENFNLFIQHHNGKLNRYKVRYRHYIDSDLNFFEIKFKNNKNRTIKNRIKRNEIEKSIRGRAGKFLLEKSALKPEELLPAIWVYYSRITLVNMFSKERLTIDFDLIYKNEEQTISFPNLVIAESKQERLRNSFFSMLMKKRHIRDISMSKYCFGVINLHEEIKKNNFKKKIIQLKKICHD